MDISIRKFLLINLLLAMTIIISLTAIGNYYLDKQDIENYLDNFLGQAGLSFTAIASREIKQQDWDKLRVRMNIGLAQKANQHNLKFHEAADGKRFQIWDIHHKLLLRSDNAPNDMLSQGKLGFSDYVLGDIHLRVYSNFDPETNLIFIVAEPYEERNRLVHHIMTDDLYIMLLTYPLAGLLIWVIIGRGLVSLKIIAEALRHREPHYLEPVNLEGVPIEIQPLIEELNKLLLRLKNAFDREKRFASDAAHELRTPLAAIRTQAQVALIWASSPEQIAILHNVITGVDRTTHIVSQLLSMSRMVAENAQLTDMQTCDLNLIVKEVLSQLDIMAQEKKITLKAKVKDKAVFIFANLAALHILVRNLVDNAIRYTPEQGLVVVSVETDGKYANLMVADNGPGVPKEFRERIFERFFRMLGNETPGSGLGLSLVKQIADLHQASIVTSATDAMTEKGLSISVSFPLLKISKNQKL